MNDRRSIDQQFAYALSRRCSLELIEPLTLREKEMLGLVCDGFSNVEIARFCGISIATVKWHLMNIFGKLGVKRRAQAVAVAVRFDLVRPEWLTGTRVRLLCDPLEAGRSAA